MLKRACSYQAVYKIDAKNQRLNHKIFSYAAMKQCGGIKTTSLVRASLEWMVSQKDYSVIQILKLAE